jgi:hypothetical protein
VCGVLAALEIGKNLGDSLEGFLRTTVPKSGNTSALELGKEMG